MVAAKNTVYYVVIISADENVQVKMRKAISRVLPQSVVESLCGAEAVRFICHSGMVPDLILLDRNERLAEEIDLVQLVRATDKMANVPLVMMSEDRYAGTYDHPGAFVQAVLTKSVFREVNQLLNSFRDIWNSMRAGKTLPGILHY